MDQNIKRDDILIICEESNLSEVLLSPCPIVGALGPSGLWLSLSADKIWNPVELINIFNELLAEYPTESVRVLATPSLLIEAVVADHAENAINPIKDLRHVTNFYDRCKAPFAIFVDEQINSLGLMGGEILQFCLPNYVTEMFLVEEFAHASITAGHPEIACLAYAEAFRSNPFYALQPSYYDSFELVALHASDTNIPGIDMPAMKVFEDFSDTTKFQQIPMMKGGVPLRIFAPTTVKSEEPNLFPPVVPKPGNIATSDLLMFGGLLLRYRYKNDFPSNEDLDFFTEETKKRLQFDWERMNELARLKTECAVFHRFGTTLSSSGAVKPFLPQAVLLVEAVRRGIPPKIATELLDKRIQQLENL